VLAPGKIANGAPFQANAGTPACPCIWLLLRLRLLRSLPLLQLRGLLPPLRLLRLGGTASNSLDTAYTGDGRHRFWRHGFEIVVGTRTHGDRPSRYQSSAPASLVADTGLAKGLTKGAASGATPS